MKYRRAAGQRFATLRHTLRVVCAMHANTLNIVATRPRTLATRSGGKRRRIAAEFLNAVAVRMQSLADVSEGALL